MKKVLWLASFFLLVPAAGYLGLTAYVSREVSARLSELVSENPAITGVVYKKLRPGFLDGSVALDAVHVTISGIQEPLLIDEAVLYDIYKGANPETPAHVTLEGVRLPGDLAPAFFGELAALGYLEPVFDAAWRGTYQPQSGLLRIEALQVAGRQMGEITLKIGVAGLDLTRIAKDPRKLTPVWLLFALPSAVLENAELVYTDASLLKRLLEKKDETGATYEALAARMIDTQLGKNRRPEVREAAAALQAFIENPEHLALRLSPPTPVSFLQMVTAKNTADFIDLLHLKVTGPTGSHAVP